MVAKKNNSRRIWQPIGGSSERYKNKKTGETISKYKYYKIYPTNKIQPVKKKPLKNSRNKIKIDKKQKISPKKQAELNKVAGKLKSRSKNIKPLKNKKSGEYGKTRIISIPIKYSRGKGIDYLSLQIEYEAFINGIRNNPRIFAVVTNVIYQYGQIISGANLIPSTLVSDLPEFTEFVSIFNEFVKKKNNSKPVKMLGFNFYVIFKSSEMEKHK